MITKDGFAGTPRIGGPVLNGAVYRLSKNPFIGRKLPGGSVRSQAIESGNPLVKPTCHSSTPVLTGMDRDSAGVASVFVRTGILQNPSVALGSQSAATPSSLERLLF